MSNEKLTMHVCINLKKTNIAQWHHLENILISFILLLNKNKIKKSNINKLKKTNQLLFFCSFDYSREYFKEEAVK